MIKSNRPFALLLAAAMVVGLWVPTLTLPAQAYAAATAVDGHRSERNVRRCDDKWRSRLRLLCRASPAAQYRTTR